METVFQRSFKPSNLYHRTHMRFIWERNIPML